MSEEKRGLFGQIFMAMMMFCFLVWVWTVAFILGWPWERTSVWRPDFRLAAVCAQGEVCGVSYGELAEAKAKGVFTSLVPPEPAGEVEEPQNWLKWKKASGEPWQIETTASSWHFQTTVRYRVEGDTPVLVEYKEIEGKTFFYGLAAAAFSLLGIYFRKLRG